MKLPHHHIKQIEINYLRSKKQYIIMPKLKIKQTIIKRLKVLKKKSNLFILVFILLFLISIANILPYIDILFCDIQAENDRNSCYINTAISKYDSSICDKIHDPLTKSDCYGIVSIVNGNVSICGDPDTPTEIAYACYKFIAGITNNLSICDRIQMQIWKDICYVDVARFNRNVSICDRIQMQIWKDICYVDVAIAKGNTTICEVQNQDNKDRCYRSSACERKDASICDNITNPYMKESCYEFVAFLKNDTSICDRIQVLDKRKCYKLVALRNDYSILKEMDPRIKEEYLRFWKASIEYLES